MGIQFNADEIFSVAVKIEENGAAFYRKAAEIHKGDSHASLLENLAKMEDVHKKIFLEMKDSLAAVYSAEKSFDPYQEAMLYLNAMADAHGGEGSPSAADALTGKETIQEILDIALGLEKKSILYYTGLKDLVPERLGKEHLETIINEEKNHVAQLQQVKAQL
ncbi:MAG: ferritin family protein [Spirochaetales bacterium]|nr:ferritin family protein [Spirochaetales bacterium]